MSKADQLGAGRFGGGVRPVSARRQAVAAATGVPTDGVAPPTELPVDRISLNPANPRSSFGDLTDLAGSLKTHGQKQAITVMNRDAFIRANPEREADLEPHTTHVVVDGSSRLAAARQAGLASVKVMVSDDQGTTSDELLESALVANIHRQDLEELDEARALHQLLGIYGSQRALAKRLHRSQGWVSQRLALLNLVPELQARIGEEPIDLLRAVGNKPPELQESALHDLKAERARKEEEVLAARGQREADSATGASSAGAMPAEAPTGEEPVESVSSNSHAEDDDAVATALTPHTQAEVVPESDPVEEEDPQPPSRPEIVAQKSAARDADDFVRSSGTVTGSAVVAAEEEQPRAEETAPGVPEPRTRNAEQSADLSVTTAEQPRTLPYDDPAFIAMHLAVKMDDSAFYELLRVLMGMSRDRNPAEFEALVNQYMSGPGSETLSADS
ncbi:ParB/RepB/Spo0J family partition protein [Streptomyces sp. NPDC048254]|uniref:ParB/RepB/Spo0J family partition protein n=1 Tax=Streptomyces sp. NPDC048254 TaxID=3365525 RepID=UPI0037238E58